MKTDAELQAELDAQTREVNELRGARVRAAIDRLVAERKLPPAEKPKALVRALADPSYLDELNLRWPLPEPIPSSKPAPPITAAPDGGPILESWSAADHLRAAPLPAAPIAERDSGKAAMLRRAAAARRS